MCSEAAQAASDLQEDVTGGPRTPSWKRPLDAIVAAIGLVLLSPVLLFIALAIKLDSRGTALFRQKRIGTNGVEFTMLKFRTMRVDADEAAHRQAVRRLARGANEGGFKPADDSRVTRVGRVLRAIDLDELPQLINVLRGEMSLVGPRPAIPYELDLYDTWHFKRFSVRPGITGLWQVNRHETVDLDSVIRLDVEYIRRCSFWFDLKIIVLTAPAMLRKSAF